MCIREIVRISSYPEPQQIYASTKSHLVPTRPSPDKFTVLLQVHGHLARQVDLEMDLFSTQCSCTAWMFSVTLVVVGICCSFMSSRDGRLPPGPFSWPIVGCLFSLRTPIHHHFAKLAKRYGPVIYLKIGMVPYVIVNNAEMAKQVLKIHDLEFADRPDTVYFKLFSFGYNDLIFSPYGETWRKLRRVSAVHLFSPARVNATAAFRKSEVANALHYVLQLSQGGGNVNLRRLFAEYNSNVLFLTLFGKKVGTIDPQSGENSLVQLIETILKEISRVINLGELIPALQCLDLHGVDRKLKHELMPQLTSVLSELLEEHKQRKAHVEATNEEFVCKDFVDVLISLEKDDALSDLSIMGMCTDMIAAGVETSRVTLEWAMAELIKNPELMLKAQEEIDKVVGKACWVQESDLQNLPFLQAIVKETLRLHPPAPFGAPHVNPKVVAIAGYMIPAKCKLLVNLWAIGQDPTCWTEPTEFKPERFLGSAINMSGQHFELIPFSAGRRMCVGYPLAVRSIPFVLATLLQAFDWSPPPGQSTIDMKEEPGFVCQRASPLTAAACLRLNQHVYASME